MMDCAQDVAVNYGEANSNDDEEELSPPFDVFVSDPCGG